MNSAAHRPTNKKRASKGELSCVFQFRRTQNLLLLLLFFFFNPTIFGRDSGQINFCQMKFFANDRYESEKMNGPTTKAYVIGPIVLCVFPVLSQFRQAFCTQTESRQTIYLYLYVCHAKEMRRTKPLAIFCCCCWCCFAFVGAHIFHFNTTYRARSTRMKEKGSNMQV